MEKLPRHRPIRRYPGAKRIIVEPDLRICPVCGEKLKARRNWHARKTIQTMNGPLFVAGKSKACPNRDCDQYGKRYYASRLWRYSLPGSSYGLDILAFIGWEHEHEHRQLVEIQRGLNQRGIAVNERNVGKLYRQFLALLHANWDRVQVSLMKTSQEHGGIIWAVDALQPEGHGLLYVLYEVISGTPVAALQCAQVNEQEMVAWLQPYQALDLPVLATLSDGEAMLVAALQTCWPQAPHQRCQVHFFNNLAESVLDFDDELRKQIRQDVGGLPKVPRQDAAGTSPPFCQNPG